jgi:hypothetical protein
MLNKFSTLERFMYRPQQQQQVENLMEFNETPDPPKFVPALCRITCGMHAALTDEPAAGIRKNLQRQ